MTTKSSFLSRLTLDRSNNPLLPMHNSRYSSLRNRPSEYDLDNLSPRADDDLISPDFHDTNSPLAKTNNTTKPSNRKPTGALNRRPSNSSSSAGSASKTRSQPLHSERVLFSGPPPPIAVSRFLYRDEEQRTGYGDYEDDNDGGDDNSAGIAASWLPGTARRAISSVIWDRSDTRAGQDHGEKPVSFDRNSVWRGLARRERAIVAELQQFLQVQEDSLNGGGNMGSQYNDAASASDDGGSTPTGMGTASMTLSSRHPGRSVSFLEPVTRSGPGGEVIPVRQPRAKKLGIGGARKGIARSMADLANLKAEEDASLASALSARKQALAKLRKLATRRHGIADELHALEGDEEEPLRLELDDLDSEHRGVCTEIQELEERLSGLKSRRRHLELRMDDVRNRREAGLSGYKNALKEVEDTVRGFLTRPPIRPLDVEALAENSKGEEPPVSPGGVEFTHLLPERRTVDMAREWWETEVDILEKRKADVDIERAALEQGGDVWEEVVNLVLNFEADLRRQMARRSSGATDNGKGKERELTAAETLKLQYEKINGVIGGLEQRLGAAEEKGWNLLIAAIGAELEAFKEAASMNREMLKAAGIAVEISPPEPTGVFREDSGTTGSHTSFHTVNGGSMLAEKLADIPAGREGEEDGEAESDNEIPPDLLAAHEDHVEDKQQSEPGRIECDGAATLDREDSENEVPAEFLVEHHDTRG